MVIRYLLLVHILSKRQGAGPIGPLLHELARQHLELAAMPLVFERIHRIFMMSSHLIGIGTQTESILYLTDLIEYALLMGHETQCAKL